MAIRQGACCPNAIGYALEEMWQETVNGLLDDYEDDDGGNHEDDGKNAKASPCLHHNQTGFLVRRATNGADKRRRMQCASCADGLGAINLRPSCIHPASTPCLKSSIITLELDI